MNFILSNDGFLNVNVATFSGRARQKCLELLQITTKCWHRKQNSEFGQVSLMSHERYLFLPVLPHRGQGCQIYHRAVHLERHAWFRLAEADKQCLQTLPLATCQSFPTWVLRKSLKMVRCITEAALWHSPRKYHPHLFCIKDGLCSCAILAGLSHCTAGANWRGTNICMGFEERIHDFVVDDFDMEKHQSIWKFNSNKGTNILYM